ncbi:MAG: hypothetical protein FVQ77_06780 [Cytophagales bacterium]|nr:hypothetical protein [Cytophagales bacterium]
MKKLNLFHAVVAIATFSFLTLQTFNCFAQPPTISSFTPSTGAVGTLVTITGTNLSSPTAFTIGGDTGIVVSSTADTLVGLVMPGSVTGAVSVTTAGGTAISVTDFTVTPTPYPGSQQGSKLVGTGAVGVASQGLSVSISSDGNTAIVGGYADNSTAGAAWVYTRTGGVWAQQGSKLFGTGAVGAARQGYSVSISSDGNTAIVGGYNDSTGAGAAWVYTRSGGVWAQQGSKLVGTGAVGAAQQGRSVSISSDGNTAIVGGHYDSSITGAAWVYTRSGSVWTQQGSKLVGSGSLSATVYQGFSVSISSDGNTAIVGGPEDNFSAGAAWVYTRSGGVWTQQGGKLDATLGIARHGYSVSISSDGNTAIVGGYADNSSAGAAWVYTRTGVVWTQQGSKLVGTGAVGAAWQGFSVSISSDGNTAIVGGYNDNTGVGAVWVYTRFSGVWTQQGSKLVGTGAVGAAQQGFSVSISSDGNTAIVGGTDDNSWAGAAWVYTVCIVTNTPASAAICPGDSILINGTYRSAAGTYSDTLTAVNGCDSVVATTLSVNPTYGISDSPLAICNGDSALIYGTYKTVAATYYDSLTTINGCDSVHSTNLSVNPTYDISDSPLAICNGDSALIYGTYKTVAATYYDSLTTINGCDSVHSTNLSVNPTYSISDSPLAICNGDSALIYGTYKTVAGNLLRQFNNN